MRLTLRRNRWLRAAMLAAWLIASGCQRLPYIDQSKPVPHDNLGRVALEDKEVKQADLLSSTHADAAAQAGQAEDDQRSRGARDLADDAPAGDPHRPRQLRGRARDRLRCPGHPDRRLRADAAQHRVRARASPARSVPARFRRSTIRRSSRPRSPRRFRLSTPPSPPASSGATTFSRSTTACRAARSA